MLSAAAAGKKEPSGQFGPEGSREFQEILFTSARDAARSRGRVRGCYARLLAGRGRGLRSRRRPGTRSLSPTAAHAEAAAHPAAGTHAAKAASDELP